MTNILCRGQSGKVMAYVITWLYQFTMENGENWMVDAWHKYCFDRDFCLALGNMSCYCHQTGTHAVLKMIKKTASNSSITTFKMALLKRWKRTLQWGTAVKTDTLFLDDSVHWELVETGKYLDRELRIRMQHSGGASVWALHKSPLDKVAHFCIKVQDLVNDGASMGLNGQ